MVLKTFNIEEEVYEKFAKYCKENGISMSKQITLFIKSQIESEKEVRDGHMKKLEAVHRNNFIKPENKDVSDSKYIG
jgi:hypothetical protein